MASVWTPTGGLGHVQGGQYGGYLFPMGPFFAACRGLGLSPWVIDRLWLGALLALAAWGTVRLLDALLQGQYGERRGIAHVVAGGIILANPYVVVFANRTSVTLLGYAALPWLMLAVHRGVRTPGRWWWPAAFALLVTSTGGGVNAAVTAWILLGPLLLLVYEPLVVGVPWADVRRFIARAAAATVAASLWWLAPIVVQGMYGIDFLKFTEQPGTIWGTTALPESLRLMGYWLSYVDVGFVGRVRLFFDDAHTMLFAPGVVVASLLVPALALAGFQWTRRWRYGPFFLALALFGLIVMVAGFPEGTPLRRALTFTYYHLQPIQFLRTPYKAAPLLVLAVAVLAGTAAAELWRRMRWVVPGSSLGMARAGLLVACAALIGASAWPLLRGRGIDRQVVWKRIPAAWTHTARGLDRTLPRNTRAVVLPGALFAFYRWGGTYDPILPALTRRPVAVRQIVPYADLHATDLLWTVDALVQQQRAYPGVLRPLLSLLGAGAVISGRDYDVARSGALDPVDAANVLADQGLAARERSYGPRRRFDPPAGELDRPLVLSQVARYDLRPDRPVVRVEPAGPQTIVDGSADGLAGLAAFGALPTKRPLLYAGDRTAADLRRAAARGADVVIT
ncbi:MAG: arabinofuranan 3-O-arabinosyltransferase, partial [Solirubrobacteraceae bacterium]|nr:arabinofuranan 3-O-arabinosyltransferase [Solirubrobacteraceae bacterium]